MGQKLRILIVADSDEASNQLNRKLKLSGYQLHSIRVDSLEALQSAIREAGWDLVISDCPADRIPAAAIMELLDATDLEIPLIVLSNIQGEEAAVAAMKAGAADYIMKDRLNRLVPSIKRSLREAKTRRDRKMSDQALERTISELDWSRAEMEEFAYIASHDLRAPLRAINNLTQWIEEDLETHLQGETRRNMDLLKGRVRRMERMIDSILAYARADRAEITVEKVNLNELLNDVIDLLSPPPPFVIEIDDDMPVFWTAPSPLHQVFSNLINNAIKHHHCPDEGRVKISVSEEGDYFRFTVADNGPGIPEAFHDDIFMMFKTLKSRDKVEGTGIGLALVKKIIKRAGGWLELESSQGKGSTFTVCWPREWDKGGARQETVQSASLAHHRA